MKKIVLTTLNARYTHASLALRYLYANLGALKDDAVVREFVINEDMQGVAESILAYSPLVVGIGAYIWSALDVKELISIIKKVLPQTQNDIPMIADDTQSFKGRGLPTIIADKLR